ncbi:metallophosphoesteras-like protein [Bimuria novae-zelandiae CBS 107.79]|uniref:Metallophosphoesteras-like protein n=1 Tax=Bimuria novae-zelandiae CBS 107.79 TaxID=1447943 RepID=A0A6A5VMR2_9PLEO|nr:metallophosphoesteras-like protein [Bimuria novae-zelandiae CBS 107.79]
MDPLIATAVDAPAPDGTLPPPPPAEPPEPARLWAISDLHLSYKGNREELEKLEPRPSDGLIICGDVGETAEHLRQCFTTATACFRQVWWVPGNHELFTMPSSKEGGTRGAAKYMECVNIARAFGVLTPEDEFVIWDGDGGPCVIAPIFTLYDYSFRPAHVPLEEALEWANEENILATDEHLLHNDPYASRIEWCNTLVERAETKLAAAVMENLGTKLVIINHWPLREDLVNIPLVPRFIIWCGTKQTEDWHNKYNAKVVVSGHLHVRRTDWKDDTRFEEVSLGYPKQWKDCQERGMDINDLLREILPGPDAPRSGEPTTWWRRYGKGTSETPAIFLKNGAKP